MTMTFAALFSVSLFTSAFLMFALEPMLGKHLLPLLGGAPEVWTTCMAFYQIMLLAGYAYAHVLAKTFSLKKQLLIHGGFMAASFAAVPLLTAGGGTPDETIPAAWTIGHLLVKAGLPFFILSTSSPLLQSWFVALRTRESHKPYFLYVASNLGSFAALFAYPFLIETSLRLTVQFKATAAGYVVFAVLVSLCGLAAYKRSSDYVPARAAQKTRIAGTEALAWGFQAFVPSSMMLGLTTWLVQEIAPMPLLWMAPLALYLLSHVVAFSRVGPRLHGFAAGAQLALLLIVIPTYVWGIDDLQIAPLHLLFFFFTALVCHGELARIKPAPERLTSFYLAIAIGGALGGAFNAVAAPVIFNGITEYPIMILLSVLARPGDITAAHDVKEPWRDLLYPAAGALLIAAAFPYAESRIMSVALATVCGMAAVFRNRPMRLFMAVCMLSMLMALFKQTDGAATSLLYAGRNFFGTYRIVTQQTPQGAVKTLIHGSTVHGAQSEIPDRTREPLSYYAEPGPLGDIFKTFGARDADWNVAVVGMGTAAAACYAKPGQAWTWYEINPDIAAINAEKALFTFYENCTPDAGIVLGDARIELARRKPERPYDLIVLDAFAGDSVPAHLLTREAFELYLSRLAENGIVAVHISNRHLTLEPVVANVARSLDLAAYTRYDAGGASPFRNASQWMAVARDGKTLEPLRRSGEWREARISPELGVWTDDFHNLWSIIAWRK